MKRIWHLVDNSKGFTLIEVIIAVMILATISALTAGSISNALRDKKRIQNNVDRLSTIRSAYKVVERDIQMAFHFRDINEEVLREVEKARKKKKKKGAQQPGDPTDTVEELENLTKFIGEENQIHFTSLNHQRVYSGRSEGDQQEVGYYVADCRTLGKPDESSKCLWRRASPYIDEKTEEGGQARVLVEKVTEFKLRYYSSEDDEYVSVWKSDDSGDARTKDKFPDAVEVTLEIEAIQKRKDRIVSLVPIRFPNNTPKENESETGGGDEGADGGDGDDDNQ